jgi:hypothetical protein
VPQAPTQDRPLVLVHQLKHQKSLLPHLTECNPFALRTIRGEPHATACMTESCCMLSAMLWVQTVRHLVQSASDLSNTVRCTISSNDSIGEIGLPAESSMTMFNRSRVSCCCSSVKANTRADGCHACGACDATDLDCCF